MVVLLCPKCESRTKVEAPAESASCESCGHLLSAQDSHPDNAAEHADRSIVDMLRRAFQEDSSSSHILMPMPLGSEVTEPDGADLPSESSAPLVPGSRLGEFEIVEELGHGGMGIVYRAWQSTLNREVALKVLPMGRGKSSSGVRRFHTEARAAARLHHENLVPIYAQGEVEGQLFFCMELVDGISLDTAIRSRPELLSSGYHWDQSALSKSRSFSKSAQSGGKPSDLEDAEEYEEPASVDIRFSREDYRHIARLAAGAAEGLAHAHERGVVHRDIKPHNILLGSDGRLHITDFGLAYLTDEPHITVSGEIIGTPAYLSPEQISGGVGDIDHRTDIFSFGVTMYELITRRRPFDGETREQLFNSICNEEARPPRKLDPSIPVDLDTICLRAMEKAPDRRYPSAGALAEDLRRFADGRPILSRRTGPIEKALKWVRRHKAASVAIAASLGIVILAGSLAGSRAVHRRSQAARYLNEAYARLAHQDYRKPDLVEESLGLAEQLGAEPIKLGLTRTLAHLGRQDFEEAIAEARGALELDPENDQAMYLIAWAHAEGKNGAAARAQVEEADRLGGPQSAEAWFFRGFAVHHDRPTGAIDSYLKAIRLLAEQEDYYPQASLHLARAYNQRLYVERNLEDFSQVKSKLEELIKYNYGGAYPHYLLSIGHRLAGEVYAGTGGSGDRNAQMHFEKALETARAGQALEPTKNRPATAEAECLESLGRWEEAIDARTRALALAEVENHIYEQYHYRWRLYYWTGDYEAALQDIDRHRVFQPRSIYYRHLYPALVFAEMGDHEAAIEEVRSAVEGSPEDAQTVIAGAAWLRLFDRHDEADMLLISSADKVRYDVALQPGQTPEWVEALYRFCDGTGTMERLDEIASQSDTPWKLDAEGHFYSAMRALSNADRRSALGQFDASYRSFDSQQRYTFHSKLFFERMQDNARWPEWLAAHPGASPLVGSDAEE